MGKNKISPDLDFTPEQMAKVKNAVKDPNAEFFFVASNDLKQIFIKGDHPVLSKIDAGFQKVLIEGNGIKISSKMVLEYIEGKLGEDNTQLLDLGHIMVQGTGGTFIDPGDVKSRNT